MNSNRKESRFVNETAGTLVIIGVVLFAVGIILAGRTKGWFEGAIEVRAVFRDSKGLPSEEQGSFDLQEGDEVRIRSTLAGKVESIVPSDSGGLEAVMRIKRRFHQYIRVDSLATVKRKFGLAGDAYVEISGGKDEQIETGGTILCYKDEELMEIAQKALARIEDSVVPMVVEVTGVMSNANRIAGQISGGEGLIGTMVNDPGLAQDVRDTVKRLNTLLSASEEAVHETTTLMRGAQKHWLIRRYIPDENESVYISPLFGYFGEADPALRRRCKRELDEARELASPAETIRAAYNAAMCSIAEGKMKEARLLLDEGALSGNTSEIGLLHLKAASLYVSPESVGQIKMEKPRGMEHEDFCEFLALRILTSDKSERLELLDEHASRIKKKGSSLARAALYRALAEQCRTENLSDAAQLYEREAHELSQLKLPAEMVTALHHSAECCEEDGQFEQAALRYLACGKSLLVQNRGQEGIKYLSIAARNSQAVDNKPLTDFILDFSTRYLADQVK